MERNDEWWGTEGNYWGKGQPFLDKIIYAFVPDNTSVVNGFESGEFDYLSIMMFPRNEWERFSEMEGIETTLAGMNMNPIQVPYSFNLRNDIVNDKCVRQAIAYSLDLDEINKKVFYGTGSPSMSFLAPDHPEFNQDLLPWRYQPRDVEKAEAMLDECGYPRGDDGWRFELKVSYDTRAERTDLAMVFKQFIEEIGIKFVDAGGDYSVWVEETYINHDFDVSVATLGVSEPSVGVARLFISTNIGEARFNNVSAYVNPEMDELWKTYSSTFDPEEKKAAIDRIQEIILEDLPVIYVNSNSYPNGWNDEFIGFHHDNAYGAGLLRNVWWTQGTPAP
jgi:peptide/nickel transport system substrate-binding protein